MPAEDFPLALRGVYAQPYTIGGRREYYAVDSMGEQAASRLVRKDATEAHLEEVIRDLWDELNEADPIAPHLTPPFLRLVD